MEAQALVAGEVVGCALGEAPTAEEAEERARRRLQIQLQEPLQPPRQPAPSSRTDSPEPAVRARAQVQLPHRSPPPPAAPPTAEALAPEPGLALASAPAPAPGLAPGPADQTRLDLAPQATTEEPPGDPEDWSSELARIDLQLQRLGWQRPEESSYLERAFGHPSRSRITTYADLTAYLRTLETLERGCDPASVPVPLRRRDLLSQSDMLLAQLGWSAGEGRRFLEQHLGLASRQQLSDPQLLQFNMLLEEAVLESGTPAAPPTGAGDQAPAGPPPG